MLSPAMLWGNGNPKLISIVGPGLLAYTNDLKNWIQVNVSIGADGVAKGIAYNSIDDVLMMSNYTKTSSQRIQQLRKTKLANVKSKASYTNAYNPSVSGYDPTSGKLTYDSGKWMWGDINSKVCMSQNNGTSWTGFNTWSSSTTRNPSIVRYFNSQARYVTCYPNVSSIGLSPSGSFNSAGWSVVSTGFTTQTRFVTEGITGNFLAIGGSAAVGQIATSTNLSIWTSRTWINTSLPNWAVWNGSVWVIVANGGNIGTSTNGVSWTSRTSGVVTNLLWVDWDSKNNQFVTVGNNMTILVSPDGINWTNKNAVTTNFSSSTTPIQTIRVS